MYQLYEGTNGRYSILAFMMSPLAVIIVELFHQTGTLVSEVSDVNF